MLMRSGIGPAGALRDHGIAVRADLPGVGGNLSNHSLLFVGFHLPPQARQSPQLRPHPTTVLRFSSGVPGCPRTDMYVNVQSKTSWSALGQRIANLAPALWKPMGRGRVALRSADSQREPLVEMNFAGHELDLKRLMVGFRLAVEMLAHPKVRALSGVQFPVKFTDRLRQLNQKTAANAVKSPAIAWLTDLVPPLAGPIFGTLADRRVDLAALVRDDAALAEHIRQNVAGMFHVAGTCRMGFAGRSRRGGRHRRPRARHRRPAGGRCVADADGAARQHQHPDHHAGGEDFRGDVRWGAIVGGPHNFFASWPGIAVRRTASLRSPMSRPSRLGWHGAHLIGIAGTSPAMTTFVSGAIGSTELNRGTAAPLDASYWRINCFFCFALCGAQNCGKKGCELFQFAGGEVRPAAPCPSASLHRLSHFGEIAWTHRPHPSPKPQGPRRRLPSPSR